MAETATFVETPAFEVAAGHAVIRRAPGVAPVLGLKGRRVAPRHVQDYVVALDPVAEGGFRLDFVDPETVLEDWGSCLSFVAGPATAGNGPCRPMPGELAATAEGLWLAVREISVPYAFVSFVEVATGEVRRLRAPAILALHPHWRIEAPAALAAAFPAVSRGR